MKLESVVYVVLERDGTDTVIENDCEVFGSEEKARAYMEKRVKQMTEYIDNSVVEHEGDDDYYVVSESGAEWYEVQLMKKEMQC